MHIGLLILSIALALASVPFFLGFGSSLIAGFNTASDEEKSRVNTVLLCRTVGVLLLCIAILTFLWSIYGDGFYPWFIVLAGAVVVGSILFGTLCCKKKKP